MRNAIELIKPFHSSVLLKMRLRISISTSVRPSVSHPFVKLWKSRVLRVKGERPPLVASVGRVSGLVLSNFFLIRKTQRRFSLKPAPIPRAKRVNCPDPQLHIHTYIHTHTHIDMRHFKSIKGIVECLLACALPCHPYNRRTHGSGSERNLHK